VDRILCQLRHCLAHSGIFALLVIHLVLGIATAFEKPLGEAPDEVAHFTAVNFIAREGRLPTSYEDRDEAGRKSDWPLLYHAIVGSIVGHIDDSDLPTTKLQDRTLEQVLITNEISPFVLVHTLDEVFPYRGAVLRWRIARIVSILIGACTLAVVYLTGLQVFRGNRWLSLAMPLTLLVVPQFHLISTAVSDDNLLGLLSALFVLALVKIVFEPRPLFPYLVGGLCFGLALTTKYSVALLALLAPGLLILTLRQGNLTLRDALVRIAVFLTSMIGGAGWWLAYLGMYFNEIDTLGMPLGLLKPFLVGDMSTSRIFSFLTVGSLSTGISENWPGMIWNWTVRLVQSFWLTAGQHMRVILPTVYYLPFVMLALLAVGGVLRSQSQRQRLPRNLIMVLVLNLLLLLPFPLVRLFLTTSPEESGQGRHILIPGATAFSLLFCVGLRAWLPPKLQNIGLFSALGVLFLAGQLALHLIVIPSYGVPLPVRTSKSAVADVPNSMQLTLAPGVDLIGYHIGRPSDDGALPVELVWHCTSKPDRDYVTFVSLLSREGQTVAGWVGHPANGAYPTRAWQKGDVVYDRAWLVLPRGASVAYRIRVELKWVSDTVYSIIPQPGSAVSDDDTLMAEFRFGSDVSGPLDDFAGSDQGVSAGLTLWQSGVAAKDMPTFGYRSTIPITMEDVSSRPVMIVDEGGRERLPLAQMGNTVLFLVGGDWRNGLYRLRVSDNHGVVTGEPILRVQQRQREFSVPSLQQEVNANLGDELRFLGFEIPSRKVQAGSGLSLIWYWQALRTMTADYTLYVQVLSDQDLSHWGGVDHVPLGYYPTRAWVPHEVVSDQTMVSIRHDAPPGVYRLHVGAYSLQDGQVKYLPLTTEDGLTNTNHVMITKIKIGGPPPGVTVSQPSPGHARTDRLGDLVTLIGYDLETQRDHLTLTLFWRCEAPMTIDYTTFVHVTTAGGGEIVGQMDGPPAGGKYPTSLWDVGEVIRDVVPVPLPEDLPGGDYEIRVGLYDAATGLRLPVAAEPGGAVLLTTMHRGARP
jgi:hypothetical protein